MKNKLWSLRATIHRGLSFVRGLFIRRSKIKKADVVESEPLPRMTTPFL